MILELIKELKDIDFRKSGSSETAINLFRNEVNKMLTGSPFGYQLITPISLLTYEKNVSAKLSRIKLPLQNLDFFIQFITAMDGFLERYKSYFISKEK